MQRSQVFGGFFICAACAFVPAAFAHHSYAIFDTTTVVTIDGISLVAAGTPSGGRGRKLKEPSSRKGLEPAPQRQPIDDLLPERRSAVYRGPRDDRLKRSAREYRTPAASTETRRSRSRECLDVAGRRRTRALMLAFR